MTRAAGTVYVVDDDESVCRGLTHLLAAARYECRSFSSASEFLARHDPRAAGCAILDLAMPGASGLDIQAALVAEGCDLPVIFLSGHCSIADSVTAMRAGAVNFLTKPVQACELLPAIDEALQLNAEHRREKSLRASIAERIETLTPRERQVLSHVVAGRMNKQIAGDLGTVVKTIKVHRARVMHKMQARSVAQLVRMVSLSGVALEPARRVERLPRMRCDVDPTAPSLIVLECSSASPAHLA